jgi:peptidoglycan/LPS O-acetylase OafA/YrhL
MKARFDALTGIRALAVSMVFIYHNRKFWRADLHPELLRFVNEFHVGVSIFFVLSGFLLAYSYGDGPTKSPKDYGKYILGRSARVLPLYWFLLTYITSIRNLEN